MGVLESIRGCGGIGAAECVSVNEAAECSGGREEGGREDPAELCGASREGDDSMRMERGRSVCVSDGIEPGCADVLLRGRRSGSFCGVMTAGAL